MIGDRIKYARKKLGYSAEQVAEYLDVAPATIYRYENGDISKFPIKYLHPLAKFLCVSPAYLMGWDEGQTEDPPDIIPITDEAKILAKGIDKLPKEQRERAVAMFKVMFEPQYADLFTKGTENDDT